MDGHLLSDLPAEERPRERLERLGAVALSTPELLAILLRTGVQGSSATMVGARVLEHFGGSLASLASAPLAALCTLHGVGKAKAVGLAAAFELGRRLAAARLPRRISITSPAMVAQFLQTRLRQREQEEFHVLFLNTKHQVEEEECVTVGLLDRALVHAREVFRRAVRTGCHRVVLAHNHPSGDPRPSPEDVHLTKSLVAAGKVLDIQVLDHIVLGTRQADPTGMGYFSFRQARLMEEPT